MKALEMRLILTNNRDETPCWFVGVLIPEWQYGWGGGDSTTVAVAIDDFLGYFQRESHAFGWFDGWAVKGVLSPKMELPWADPV